MKILAIPIFALVSCCGAFAQDAPAPERVLHFETVPLVFAGGNPLAHDWTVTTVALQASQAPRAHYRTDGPAKLNDLTLSPGDVRTTDTAELCSKSFHTGTVRAVSESTKQAVCREYGIAKADCTGKKYEIDHIISLELGGSNDQKNLYAQPYFPRPGAKEKDVVENWLHAQVCSGNISLKTAQREISFDWYQVYLTMKKQEKR